MSKQQALLELTVRSLRDAARQSRQQEADLAKHTWLMRLTFRKPDMHGSVLARIAAEKWERLAADAERDLALFKSYQIATPYEVK